MSPHAEAASAQKSIWEGRAEHGTPRNVFITVNRRCPLSCAHCGIGFGEGKKIEDWGLTPGDIEAIVDGVDAAVYGLVIFGGGEPSLSPALLRAGIDACRRKGLRAGMVTAPIWAPEPETALGFLTRVQGLNFLVLSYDTYHLEFLSFSHYRNAALAASLRGIPVIFHICYEREAQRQELVDSLKDIGCHVEVSAARVVQVGNAEAGMAGADDVLIDSNDALLSLPRSCALGNALIKGDFGVHGCCWAASASDSPFSVAGGKDSVGRGLQTLESRPVFQAVRERGFIDSLTAGGRRRVAELVRGRRFRSECDLCAAVMREAPKDIWRECRLEFSSQDQRSEVKA